MIRCSPKHPSCPPCHAQLVEGYRWARQAYLDRLEQATALYPAEVADYKRQHPPVTFKAWLIGSAQHRREQAA